MPFTRITMAKLMLHKHMTVLVLSQLNAYEARKEKRENQFKTPEISKFSFPLTFSRDLKAS